MVLPTFLLSAWDLLKADSMKALRRRTAERGQKERKVIKERLERHQTAVPTLVEVNNIESGSRALHQPRGHQSDYRGEALMPEVEGTTRGPDNSSQGLSCLCKLWSHVSTRINRKLWSQGEQGLHFKGLYFKGLLLPLVVCFKVVSVSSIEATHLVGPSRNVKSGRLCHSIQVICGKLESRRLCIDFECIRTVMEEVGIQNAMLSKATYIHYCS